MGTIHEVASTPSLEMFLSRPMPHYRQGDLDKACAIYCLAMVLSYHGILAPEVDIEDRRRAFPKFLKGVYGEDPMVLQGTDREQIVKAARYFNGRLHLEEISVRDGNRAAFELLREQVAVNKLPVILGYSGDGYNHSAVVTGVGRFKGHDTIFLMCPSGSSVLGSDGGTLFNDAIWLGRGGSLKSHAAGTLELLDAFVASTR